MEVSIPANEKRAVRSSKIQDTKLYKERREYSLFLHAKSQVLMNNLEKRAGFLKAVGDILNDNGDINDETFPLYSRDDLLWMLEEVPTHRLSEEEKDALYERFGEEREDPKVLEDRVVQADNDRTGDDHKENMLPDVSDVSI